MYISKLTDLNINFGSSIRFYYISAFMNNILPGFIDSYPEDESILNKIPAGRYGKVSEIADTALFLLSPGSGYITGQNIRVDGGITKSV